MNKFTILNGLVAALMTWLDYAVLGWLGLTPTGVEVYILYGINWIQLAAFEIYKTLNGGR